ncbi:MAG TPA: glutamate racemase, partial [Rhodococcus sp. (in: high G+C Gram-positive bacteria)]|nr:glutamate racemase [Rhodococcus sp. (in: high G+C Gram-positive bacteria)]
AQLPAGVRLFDSAEAVAQQTLRRMDALGRDSPGSGRIEVFLSGERGTLPAGAGAFAAGRELFGTAPNPIG